MMVRGDGFLNKGRNRSGRAVLRGELMAMGVWQGKDEQKKHRRHPPNGHRSLQWGRYFPIWPLPDWYWRAVRFLFYETTLEQGRSGALNSRAVWGVRSSCLGIMRTGENRSKAVETVVSQRALQMGTSFPCRICVVGFLFGVCLTTLFLAALTSGSFAFGGISFSSFSNGITSWNVASTSDMSDIDQEKVSFLYSAWSALLNESMKGQGDQLPQGADQVRNVPKAPHLEDCKLSAQLNKKLDKRVENESFPPWTLWKGLLDTYPSSERRKSDEGAYPPWGLRYLMRFQTEYTCNLLNAERHAAFGREAAKMVVLATPAKKWLEEVTEEPQSDIERFVWSNHKPWIPRPLLSMHVRMGDKASEMKVVGFEGYMNLAERIRKRFPNVHNILISSEMQEVIDKLRSYTRWNFYYTNVTRQVGNTSMADYSASLGPEVSTNYPLVNFLMAVDSDFFVGALGSTWSYLIDGMRSTGGKVMAGYLSVNRDRFW
ncbi:hypothetical protein RHSIM_Rhsim09G0136000 [Rhododendron simsii]|uniref:O-fucosyltransferase family protein n=1 Tax=Rhododendron simsii TaxID=118357 RepID=A0A834GGU2_RHOSS|nr:hypothetical protein RHSIM_Rhsim09G0136000 [Rhododendron simsii]